MTREEGLRYMLSRQDVGTRRDIMQIAIHRTGDGYDLWAPGHCACGPATHVGLPLDAAVQQILTWRPERVKS